MDAKELRIGNWYNEFGIPKQVYPEFIRQLSDIQSRGNIAIDVTAIPLTEEWLHKLGYVVNDDFGNWHFKDYVIYTNVGAIAVKDGEFYWYFACEDDYYSWLKEISFVHELQNIAFAITGKELEFKNDSMVSDVIVFNRKSAKMDEGCFSHSDEVINGFRCECPVGTMCSRDENGNVVCDECGILK